MSALPLRRCSASTIRVLQFTNMINRYDFIDNVVRHCDRQRFQMYVCSSTDSNIEAPFYADVPHYVLDVGGRSTFPRAIAKLVAILTRERIDIVHTHHFDPMMIGVTAARLAGCRGVIGRHYADSIHMTKSWWKREVYLRTESLFNGLAARIIVPSTHVYSLLTRVQGINPSKVVCIPLGFDLAKYTSSVECRARLRNEFAPDNQLLIACIGRLHPEKGQVYLLRAIQTLVPTYPHLRLLFIGAGPDMQSLQSTVHELKLSDHVVFTGWRKDVVDLLPAIDIVVQPSITESFGQVMIEALAMKRPLIMSDMGCARDVVQHGVNGLIVPPADSASIVAAIRSLLEDPHLARRLGEAGRACVERNLDIRLIVRRYEECYQSVHAESRAA